MLGANLIGFQSSSYLQHFTSSCNRILEFKATAEGVQTYGSHCAVGVFSIGIDAAKVEANSRQPGIEEKMKAIKEMYAGKKIIVGRDRLDSVRGVMQKLRAFEAFLDMFEEWRGEVSPIVFSSLPHQNFTPQIFYITHRICSLSAFLSDFIKPENAVLEKFAGTNRHQTP